jgi:two-component system, NarL family, response regulator NreC
MESIMCTRIVLADDHQIIRAGLKSLIETHANFQVVGEAENGRQAVKLVEELSPQIVIMDISMPDLNGIDAAHQILCNHPETKIIALSMHTDKRFVLGMLKAGASGYLLKDCAFDELTIAIDSVVKGQTYLSPQITNVVLQNLKMDSKNEDNSVLFSLSEREREVLQLLAEGKATKQIATILFISVKTVETHRHNIMEKLEIYNLADLIKLAIREGLTSLEK